MCSTYQCKKQNLRSNWAKEVGFCCQRCFGVVPESCLSQRVFGDGSPTSTGLISAWADGGGTVLLVKRSPSSLCIAVNTHTPVCRQTHSSGVSFWKCFLCRTDGALVPPGREQLWFFPFLFVYMSHPVWRSPFYSPLFFLWFMLAASNYSFSFGKRYHPVLLHSCFLFHSACLALSGPFLSVLCHTVFSSMLWGYKGNRKDLLC